MCKISDLRKMDSKQVLEMIKSSSPCVLLHLDGEYFDFKTSSGRCYSVPKYIAIVPGNMKFSWLHKIMPHKEIKRFFEDFEISSISFEEIKSEFPQIKFVVENPNFVSKKICGIFLEGSQFYGLSFIFSG